ncbi:MAG: cation-transporting P-type ATPase [Xanthomonadales bacterium]|nr:cation-transporting P-type ATPase [Gammaproteobacteria bacterium]MBT8053608.1 cation-transporting P-type ATPase [Gammaproteobacteria bacterium]NND58614.1 cation-transporting P-type ATPase [Xanthomonadales bacterium]NNK50996.1 cation-transporting P-type ATPase [Xanthomonadales bacterium]
MTADLDKQTPNSGPVPWAMEPKDAVAVFEVDPSTGLDDREATLRLQRYGKNLLTAIKTRHVAGIFVDQLKSAVILLLAAAAIVAMAFGDYIEGMAILAVVAINTVIGFLTEWRAVRSMEALRRLGRTETVVLRDRQPRKIAADGIVPGDIVMFEAGDIIAADMRLLEASKLQANEASLTGESMPVGKQIAPLPAETPLMERDNCLFKGTAVARGSGLGLVFATGPATELGRISKLVAEAEAQETPLEKRLDALGQRLVWVMLVVAAIIAVAGVLTGREILLAIEVAIALAVAAIPEGLPIVATIALARGMWRMAKRNALIVRLSAVETLGATGVILTDKTGTLTESRMTVSEIGLPAGTIRVGGTGLEVTGDFSLEGEGGGANLPEELDELLQAVVLCSNANLEIEASGLAAVVGDPTEAALMVAAAKRNIRREDLQQSMPELREEPFDPETKTMATFNQVKDGILVSVKGAPEAVLPNCIALRTGGDEIAMDDGQRESFLALAQEMGSKGLRTLAVATKLTGDSQAEPFADLVYLGTLGLIDPPRAGVKEAIARCRDAGVKVVMVTGDHGATARSIAVNLGLVTADSSADTVQDARSLFREGRPIRASDLDHVHAIARANPQQKLELIEHYQNQGNVVAMTGDGVNDAPALKKADIGIAMGVRGTDVAREAAAMVLQDDEFSTIVAAISHGRTIYENIRKFVVYLFSCNASEILIVGLATVAGAPLPLLPLQILFLNLVTDVFPALALGVSGHSPGVMKRRPRPVDERILTRRLWTKIAVFGALMSASVLAAMAIAFYFLDFDRSRAVTVSFCTLALSQLWHVFNMRDRKSHWLRNEITRNAWVWAALGLCLVLVLGAVYTPGINTLLGLADPGASGWALIVGMSLIPLLLGPLAETVSREPDTNAR